MLRGERDVIRMGLDRGGAARARAVACQIAGENRNVFRQLAKHVAPMAQISAEGVEHNDDRPHPAPHTVMGKPDHYAYLRGMPLGRIRRFWAAIRNGAFAAP